MNVTLERPFSLDVIRKENITIASVRESASSFSGNGDLRRARAPYVYFEVPSSRHCSYVHARLLLCLLLPGLVIAPVHMSFLMSAWFALFFVPRREELPIQSVPSRNTAVPGPTFEFLAAHACCPTAFTLESCRLQRVRARHNLAPAARRPHRESPANIVAYGEWSSAPSTSLV